MGWDWEWRWTGESWEHPENLARKKMDKGSREQPCLNVLGERGSWKRGKKGKNGLDWQKIPNPQKFRDQTLLIAIGIGKEKKCFPEDEIQGIAGKP